ncbi:MAG: hypothetical protein K2M31_03035 [Muribaculaceae bacterium]|nr:hypothetical protein [Muribaculaceae bacterium]
MMKSIIFKALGLISCLLICYLATATAEAHISKDVVWGDETISLDEIIPELRPIVFSSSQPGKWTLYRKVFSKSSQKEEWYVVGSCATNENSWQTPSPDTMGYLMVNYEAYHIERDGLRLTPFKIACETGAITEEIEFLWNVYPTTPQMDILHWTFDLDKENRTCENSDMDLEIHCVGQEQYAIGVTQQKYFSLPEDLSSVKFSYVRFLTNENIYKTNVIGQWGWIIHVVAINNFGSTSGNYLLTNNYITDPEQKSIIEKWNPDYITSIKDVNLTDTPLYSISGRMISLSDNIRQATLYDTYGYIHGRWSECGSYDLSALSGIYILTIEDSASRSSSYKICL